MLPLLLCPACTQPQVTAQAAHRLRCAACATEFPVFTSGAAEIPWLFADPANALLEWRARFAGFAERNRAEQNRLQRGLAEPRISALARARLEALLSARKRHCGQIKKLLSPLSITGSRPEQAELSANKVPSQQGLLSYYANVFRDWSWNNGEHEALASVLSEVAGPRDLGRGNVLTLGSGAGRLSYDVHRRWRPPLSIALDINPLLQALAGRIVTGEAVSLYEFPIAPIAADRGAVLQECRAPEPVDDNFQLLLADGMNPPFAPASFATVLTPWLIDIMPQDLQEFVPRLNRLLDKGGVWLNTGTLAFFHDTASWCYTEDEVLEIVESCGFRVLAKTSHTLAYMSSPLSGHGRRERVFSVCAEKTRELDTPTKPYRFLPDWLTTTGRSLPVRVRCRARHERFALTRARWYLMFASARGEH